MTRYWIVGYDGSPSAENTVDWAAAQARLRDVRLRLVSAWDVPVLARLSGIRMASGVDAAGLEATASYHLDTELTRLTDAGFDAEGEAVQGDARSVLLGAGAAADLVVLGQRGHDGSGPLHLGSVSRHCATNSDKPTIVVPADSGAEPVTRIAVGFDGSEPSRAALRWALAFARPDTRIEIVRAFEVMNWLSPAATIERFQPEIDDARAAFESEVAAIDTEGRGTLRFEVGDARETFDEIAEHVDLLAVGNRGSGRLTAALLGSVAGHLLHHARTPTAVVPG